MTAEVAAPEDFYIADEEQMQRFAEAMQREPKTFTSLDKLFEGGYHALFHGKTGGGKTTLILNTAMHLHDGGHRILYRDDTGLECRYLLPYIPIVFWKPEGARYKLRIEGLESYDAEIREFTGPGEILDEVFKTRRRFHVIVYDVYCQLSLQAQAVFYSSLFAHLINKAVQTPPSRKKKLVFIFDELNDVVQPGGKALTPAHAAVRTLLEYNIRKLRKHKVTLMASAHRFKQLSLDVRSQFSYIFLRRSFGYDVLDFVNRNLFTVSNALFFKIVREISRMPRNMFYLFDEDNNYDRYTFPDIPRPKIDYEASGQVSMEQGQAFDELDLLTLAMRLRGASFRDIADRAGRSVSTVHKRFKRLQGLPILEGLLE